MRVLITGSRGQVGRQLELTKPDGFAVFSLARGECDITDYDAILAAARQFQPDTIVNAAAYTNVDGAESDKEAALRVNRDGAANVAAVARELRAKLLHISTNYVFSGHHSTPYAVSDEPAPVSTYGLSKLEGERTVAESGAQATIVRTGWVYAEPGNGFVQKILGRLASGKPLRVVADQVGTPTSAHDLARFLWKCVERPPQSSLVHWTNAGVTSWYDFAVAISELGSDRGIVARNSEIEPVATRDYPTPAQRPFYSVLDCYDVWGSYGPTRHWRAALADTLDQIRSTTRRLA